MNSRVVRAVVPVFMLVAGVVFVHSQAPAKPPPTAAPAAQKGAPPAFDGNIAGPEWGGHVESTSAADKNPEVGARALDWLEHYGNQLVRAPHEIVLSFYGRDVARIDDVAIVTDAGEREWKPREVEVWVSTTSPADGFTKVASATLAADAWKPIPPVKSEYAKREDPPSLIAADLRFAPTDARFVKLRILSSGKTDEPFFFRFRKLKVMEAAAPGYTPLLTRHPDILGPLSPSAAGAPAAIPAPAAPACAPAPETPPKPGHGESRNVLHLSPGGDPNDAWYSPIHLVGDAKGERPGIAALGDVSVVDRLKTAFARDYRAQPYMLSEQAGYDTVVLQLPCEGPGMSWTFKKALVAWVAAGHKLILHDSDKCTAGSSPDYSWLPYRFQADVPGAKGAAGTALRVVEDNWMLNNRRGRPGFIDTAAWESAQGIANELGDSNVVVQWDVNLCGQMVVKNVNNVFGFVLAYGHLGRGLVIWDGLDVDMRLTGWYDQVLLRELAQGFDPDNLPCSVRVGSFALTTESRFTSRTAQPGQTLVYPLSLLSNLKYKGTVTLSAVPSPAVVGLQVRFDPATVAVADEQKATMALTLPATMTPAPFALEVKGTAADGKTNSLCLQLGPPKGGELSIVSALAPPTKTWKNLEIILDASGSMKTILSGKKTRWDVALETLDQVLAKLPPDFNVGLRIYGHREASTSPKTCTDSELIVPIERLNRQNLLNRAKTFRPKGETPLVYSALQAPADLKAVGGGTVILITDGEESCKGDPVKAAAELKASGLGLRLNIVGFTLKNAKAQKDLAGFSEATGGLFYAADSGSALADAVTVAAVDKFPYSVYGGGGKLVLSGEAGDGGEPLPPGEYKVVVKAGTKELVAPKVSVGLGQSITLTIVMKNGQLVLQ